MSEDITETAPDIETASDNYASRFTGAAGRFFLQVQERIVLDFLGQLSTRPLNILELGGGHGQLTGALLKAGHQVCVHGSTAACFERLGKLKSQYPDQLSFVESAIFSVPRADRSFDAAVCIRLLAHVPRWPEVVAELTRLAAQAVVVDYAPASGFNAFYRLLFSLKRALEGNTRTFLRQTPTEIEGAFSRCGYTVTEESREFFLPMVLHRKLNSEGASGRLEAFSHSLGLTQHG